MKRRLIGAVVVVAVAVIVLPMFLGGQRSARQTQQAPTTSESTQLTEASSGSGDVKTVTIPLNQSSSTGTGQNESASQSYQADTSSKPAISAPNSTSTQASGSAAPTVPQGTMSSESSQASTANAQPAPTAAVHAKASTTQTRGTKSAEPTASQHAASISSSQAPGGNGHWGVQVGSFTDAGNAKSLASKLKTKGFPAFVATARVGKRTFHRVRVGPVASKADAAKLARRVESTVGHGVQVLEVR